MHRHLRRLALSAAIFLALAFTLIAAHGVDVLPHEYGF